mgnify:FL=1
MDLAAIAMFLLMEEASRRSVARLTGLWQRNDGSVEPGSFRFDRFQLDPGDRRLLLDGATVDLNARYLDALALMVREQGRLVSKERFHQEVWRGVPVTDEALTQCIRTLRRQLGDDAARPRFIETVPKHGYRFIARVVAIAPGAVMEAAAPKVRSRAWEEVLRQTAAGTAGAGLAGVVGGLVYGFVGAAQPGQAGAGAASVLLVLLGLTLAMALIGGAGVAFGIAASAFAPGRAWRILGGAAGGLVVGAVVKLFGVDAFNLLFGQAPTEMTGAGEGLLLGGAVGFGAWLAGRVRSPRLGVALAALAGGLAGALAPLLGGRLMGGSLDLLTRQFPGSRLNLDPIGLLTGEGRFGPVAQIVASCAEGALFGACIVGAMLFQQRRRRGH